MPTLTTDPYLGVGSDPVSATIEVGPVEFTDQKAAFINTENGVWDDYAIVSRFEQDRHLYMMGVTSPNGFQSSSSGRSKVAFAQLAYPTVLWIIDWTAQRTNQKPTIPKPELQDPNWVFLDEFLEPGMIVVMADGEVPVYRISGTMIYGHKSPENFVMLNAKFTLPPWLDPARFDREITPSMWQSGLVE